MKILHTSDWHIGQTLRSFDREDEHRHFLAQLAEILCREKPDALLVSGDVFHTGLPAIQSQELLVQALADLHHSVPDTKIVVIAGNHDSAARLEIHRQLWLSLNIHIVGRIADTNAVIPLPEGRGTIVAVPFLPRVQFDATSQSAAAEKQYQLISDLLQEAAEHPGPVVMMAHMALGKGSTVSEIGAMECRPLSSMPEGYDYLALGHIHLPMRLSDRAVYCGSPFPLTFDEDYSHHVNIVDIPGRGAEPQIREIEITPLRSMLTVEAENVQDALRRLVDLPTNLQAYVRVIIDTAELLPADIDDRARVALAGKECRFCGCGRKVRTEEKTIADDDLEMEVDEFRMLSPMEIARRYFEDENVPDAPALLEMLKQVIDNLNDTPNRL